MGRQFRERRNDRWVRFGDPWADALRAELADLAVERAAIIVSSRRVEQGRSVSDAAGERAAGVIGLAEQHVPRELVTRAARELEDLGADAIVAVGGGSSVGLGKAVQVERRRAFIAIPTTYSGSEMTSIYGVRERGVKHVARDVAVTPDVVIYDPALTLELPLEISVVSLFNAMAHSVDCLYAPGCDDEIAAMAEQSVRELAAALGGLAADPSDAGAREDALHGAYYAGALLGRAGMAIHHKLAHVIGGGFNLPHAPTHTVLLPHVIAYNRDHAPAATAILGRALGAEDPARALVELAEQVGAPTELASLGFREDDVADAARRMADATYDNPRQGSYDELCALIDGARRGLLSSTS